MIQSILVVCIGNICRSPIGEALFLQKLKPTHPDVSVHSAGLSAMVGWPADAVAQELMHERGIDISVHRAQQVTAELLFESELILTMSTDQQQQLEQQYPSIRGRVHRLGKWGSYDIPDPYQRPRAIFEQSFILIDQGVNEWHRTLWN